MLETLGEEWLIIEAFDQRENFRAMLVLAWLVAPVCSLPQSFVFRLKTHPLMQDYRNVQNLNYEEINNVGYNMIKVRYNISRCSHIFNLEKELFK